MMTTDDRTYKVIATVSTVLVITLMAAYEIRKQDSIERRIQEEKAKLEEIYAGRPPLGLEQESTDQPRLKGKSKSGNSSTRR